MNNEKEKARFVLLRVVGTSPTLLRSFHRSYGQQNIKLADLYEIVWGLEGEGKLVCLDFSDDKYGDTICFKGGTTVIQPGLRLFSPQEQDFLDSLKSNGIMSESDRSLLSGDNFILFVRDMLEEFSSNPPADIKSEYNKRLIEYNNKPPKECPLVT